MPVLLVATPVDLDPTSPAIGTPVTPVPPSAPADVRPNINLSIGEVDDKATLVGGLLAAFIAFFGNCIVSGGATTAGTGFAVDITAFMAIVGTPLGSSTPQTVGGSFAASTINYLFLREDNTWTVPPLGSPTPPVPADGHGAALLWATVTTDGAGVISIVRVARTFDQQTSRVLVAAADPANTTTGDVWYNTSNDKLCVQLAGGVKRSGAFT